MPRHRTSEKAKDKKTGGGAGRFSYEGLDRAMHEKARLGILASLAANPDGVLFNGLKQLWLANGRKPQPAPGRLERSAASRNLERHDRTATTDHVSTHSWRATAFRRLHQCVGRDCQRCPSGRAGGQPTTFVEGLVTIVMARPFFASSLYIAKFGLREATSHEGHSS